MKTTKTPSTTASKSTKLTNAPENQVSTSNPDFIMKSDNSTNPTPAVNSDNAVNSTTTANAVANENLFGNEQTATEATAITAIPEQPKQQRIGKQQRKSDFAEFKATFLTPAKVVNRHPVNIEDDIWEQLERIARILGERGTTVASYINAVLADHLRAYSPDIEIWRRL